MANDNRTSPRGTAIYPHLHAPDTKFDNAGVYSTKLRFTGRARERIEEMLEPLMEEAYEEALESVKGTAAQAKKKLEGSRRDPFEVEIDEDGEETGAIIVNFKCKASGVRRDGSTWKYTPRIFDAAGNPVRAGLRIGSGSVLKVNFEPRPYYVASIGYGVSCRLNAVQVLELQTWGGGNAESFGFDADEDGFDASEIGDEAFTDSPGDDFAAGSGGDDEFSDSDTDDSDFDPDF